MNLKFHIIVKLIFIVTLVLFSEGFFSYVRALSESKKEGITIDELLVKRKEIRRKRIASFKKWFLPSKSEKIRP